MIDVQAEAVCTPLISMPLETMSRYIQHLSMSDIACKTLGAVSDILSKKLW
jgi:hypothetical protein